MSHQTDFQKAMKFESPEYIPVAVGILPAAWMKHGDELRKVVSKYPVAYSGFQDGSAKYDEARGTYVEGKHVDAWGCVWENVHAGREAIVRGHPVASREDVRKLRIPQKDDGFPHGFMYLRLADLRGFEEVMIDFAEEPPELQMLIDKVLEYNLRQVDIHLKSLNGKGGQVVYFGDDLGMQNGLAMGADKWRKFIKPCFAQIYGTIKKAGHYVYMHTDGQIHEIIPDLIECGVDIVNPQFRANGLDNLAQVCKGKVCVDLDLDRQLLPFCKPTEIRDHVRDAVEALGDPKGGLMLRGEIDDGVPVSNAEALGAALEEYRGFFR